MTDRSKEGCACEYSARVRGDEAYRWIVTTASKEASFVDLPMQASPKKNLAIFLY